MHKNITYNCRVVFLNKKILMQNIHFSNKDVFWEGWVERVWFASSGRFQNLTHYHLRMLLIYKLNFFKILFTSGYYGLIYVVTFSITNITFVVSIQNTNVANTLVMIATAPMLSAILGSVFLREPPDRKTWVSIIITFAAIIYIFFDSLKLGLIGKSVCILLFWINWRLPKR